MRLLARMRGEPLRLLGELRVQVIVGVARVRSAPSPDGPPGSGVLLTFFSSIRHSFAAAERTCAPSIAAAITNGGKRRRVSSTDLKVSRVW